MSYRPISRHPAVLHILTKNQRRTSGRHGPETRAIASIKVDELQVEGVNVAGKEAVAHVSDNCSLGEALSAQGMDRP